jgi:hypothetical protein
MTTGQLISTIVGAAFNIAVIICNAINPAIAEILVQIAPEVNIIVIAALGLFGYTANRQRRKNAA